MTTPFTKKDIFKMRLRDEPIFIDCIEMGLPLGKWATREIAAMLHECEVLVVDEDGFTVAKHEIQSRVRCTVTKKERVLTIEKGQTLHKPHDKSRKSLISNGS